MEKTYGIHAIYHLLKTKPHCISRLYLQIGRKDQRYLEVCSLAGRLNVSTRLLTRSALDDLLGREGAVHQGVVADLKQWPDYTERDLSCFLSKENGLLLVLDGVKDPHNLGSCLRVANAFGVDAVIVLKHRAAHVTATVRKVACGAAELTPVVSVTNLSRILLSLKSQGFWVVGAEGTAHNELSSIALTAPMVLVLGSEEKGLRRLTKERCDEMVRIPVSGDIRSLNVSVAAGICLYEISRQRALLK